MRITVDTAILVRANAKANGPAKALLDTIERCGSVLVLSPYLLQEVERVLAYPRMQAIYKLNEMEVQQHVDYLTSFAEIVTPAQGPPVVHADPDDDPVIYTAVAGGADVVCTLDKHFYEPAVLSFCARQRIRVMNEVQLLQLLRAQLPS